MKLVAIREMGVMGRLGIPQNVRQRLKWEDGCKLDIFLDGDQVVIRARPSKSETIEEVVED